LRHLLLLAAAAAVSVGYGQSIVVVSAASYRAPVAPASLVSIFGVNMSGQTAQAEPDANGQLPTTLGGVSVQVGGQLAQLYYVSSSQINLVMPAAIGSGTANVVVQPSGGGAALQTTVEVQTAAPALFSLDGSGTGPGAILNAVTFASGPFLVETQQNLGDDKRTRIALYGTGIRYAGNPFLDPSVTNAAASVTAQASDSAGNIYNLPVEFAGAAPTYFGLDQVNVVLPPQLDGLGQLSVTVTAGAASSNAVTMTVNALPASDLRLVGVSLAQNSVTAGQSVAGTVTLNAPARQGGFAVSLSSSDPSVQAPATVVVPQGSVSAAFTVQVASSSSGGSITITASANRDSRSALLIVTSPNGPSLSALTLSAVSVSGGTSVTGTVNLSAAAPSGGVAVQLSASQAVAQPPATVTVTSGQSSATFTITTSAVTAAQTVTITASYAGQSQIATLAVNPSLTLALSSNTVIGGQGVTATATLGNPAPASGARISFSSSNQQAAQLSATSVPVVAGGTTASVSITTSAATTSRTVAIAATSGSATGSATLIVLPAGAPVLVGLTVSPASLQGGNSATGTVTLSTASTTLAGASVTLQSSNTLVATVPASVAIGTGQTTATFAITTSAVSASQSVTITATLNGVAQTATLTVQ
jgi:uncharacterized protein (TIGR03437 family)